jgi:predicted transcriptional regulator
LLSNSYLNGVGFNRFNITLLLREMKSLCEEVSRDIIPAARALLVKDLVEKHGLSQVEIASRLGITQPAVSQYLRSLRGTNRTEVLLRSSDFMESLMRLSDDVAAGKLHGIKISEMYCKL